MAHELTEEERHMIDKILLWGPLNESEIEAQCGSSWRSVWASLVEKRIVRFAPYAREKRCYRYNEHYYSERIKNAK